jgi:hypothetical protein
MRHVYCRSRERTEANNDADLIGGGNCDAQKHALTLDEATVDMPTTATTVNNGHVNTVFANHHEHHLLIDNADDDIMLNDDGFYAQHSEAREHLSPEPSSLCHLPPLREKKTFFFAHYKYAEHTRL